MSTVINALMPDTGRPRFFRGREEELIAFISQGKTQPQAAAHFGCNLSTVEKELARLRKKAAVPTDKRPSTRNADPSVPTGG